MTNSESAYISLPSNSKYLVRITTNDSPGSYPIVVDTTIHTPKVMSCPEVKTFYGYSYRNSVYLIVFLFVLTICFLLKSVRDTCSKYYIKKNLINNPNKLAIIMEEGRKWWNWQRKIICFKGYIRSWRNDNGSGQIMRPQSKIY